VRRDDALVVGATLGVALTFTVAELRLAGTMGLPLDDGWIHLRFANNLARGLGFAINPGQPVAGSTAPLWTLCLAAAVAVGIPGLAAAKALGLACAAATGCLTRRLGSALGLAPPVALGAGLAVVGLGRLAWGALSGMEVALATALVTAAALLAVRGRPLVATATLGLAVLARPEAGLLLVLHAFAGRRPLAALVRAGVGALVVAPSLAFSWLTVGRLVPAPAAAKVEGGLLGRFEGVPDTWGAVTARVAAWLVEWGSLLLGDHPALPALAVIGWWLVRRSALGWLAAALVLHPVAMALMAPYRGPGFQTGRYSSHLLPLAVVLAAAGLGAVLARVPRGRAVRAGIVVGLAVVLAVELGPAARAYAWGVQNITTMQVTLGRWVARHTPPGARLAVNDIGALSYFGDRPVLDLMGLVSPEVLSYRRQGPVGLLRYLERVCPDYLVIFPAWFPELAARADLFRPLTGVRLAHNVVSGADEMVVYETAWNRWVPRARPCAAASG
jgi:hypothetical protein